MKMEKQDEKSRILRGIYGVSLEKQKSHSIKTWKEKRRRKREKKGVEKIRNFR
jgi:hypothetical protein